MHIPHGCMLECSFSFLCIFQRESWDYSDYERMSTLPTILIPQGKGGLTLYETPQTPTPALVLFPYWTPNSPFLTAAGDTYHRRLCKTPNWRIRGGIWRNGVCQCIISSFALWFIRLIKVDLVCQSSTRLSLCREKEDKSIVFALFLFWGVSFSFLFNQIFRKITEDAQFNYLSHF